MALKQGIARKLGWLLACLWIAGAGCDDDSAADDAHSHEDGNHAHEDGDHTHEDGDHAHGAAGSGGHDRVIGPMTGATCPDGGSSLTYENFGEKFFQDYCLSCHSVSSANRNGAPDDHNFDTLADVEIMKAHIDQYAGSGPSATNTKMPPEGNPAPSEDERKQLSEWLACGPK